MHTADTLHHLVVQHDGCDIVVLSRQHDKHKHQASTMLTLGLPSTNMNFSLEAEGTLRLSNWSCQKRPYKQVAA